MNMRLVGSNDKNAGKNSKAESYFNGAAIIDQRGHEIPITEQMIQQACIKSKAVWPFGPIVDNEINGIELF